MLEDNRIISYKHQQKVGSVQPPTAQNTPTGTAVPLRPLEVVVTFYLHGYTNVLLNFVLILES